MLMKHRHDESFGYMKGHFKTQSWAEKERAEAIELTNEHDRMEQLKEKLEREKKCSFDDCL